MYPFVLVLYPIRNQRIERYSLASLILASLVVNCQLILAAFAARSLYMPTSDNRHLPVPCCPFWFQCSISDPYCEVLPFLIIVFLVIWLIICRSGVYSLNICWKLLKKLCVYKKHSAIIQTNQSTEKNPSWRVKYTRDQKVLPQMITLSAFVLSGHEQRGSNNWSTNPACRRKRIPACRLLFLFPHCVLFN